MYNGFRKIPLTSILRFLGQMLINFVKDILNAYYFNHSIDRFHFPAYQKTLILSFITLILHISSNAKLKIRS